jgi:hypothetical protein
MTAQQLQDIMDQAWKLAIKEMNLTDLIDTEDLSWADFHSLNSLQTEIFERLGGDLEEYQAKVF